MLAKIVLFLLTLRPSLTARALAFYIGTIQRHRADRIQANLARFMPEITDLPAFLRAHYRMWAELYTEYFEIVRGVPDDRILRDVTFTNPELISEHLAAGHKVLLACAHTANVDWVWLALCLRYRAHDLAMIGRLQGNDAVDTAGWAMRKRYGKTIVTSQEVGEKILRAETHPDLLYVHADLEPHSEAIRYGEQTPFLGHEVLIFASLPHLAAKMGMHVVYGDLRRRGYGAIDITFRDLSGPPAREDAPEVQQAYVSAVEQSVRAAPENWWFWTRELIKPEAAPGAASSSIQRKD